MTLSNVTDELAEKFNLGDSHQGALVVAVKPRSAAAKAGVAPGDVITRVGNAPVKNAKEASDALNNQELAKGVRIYVTGPDGSRFLFIERQEQ